MFRNLFKPTSKIGKQADNDNAEGKGPGMTLSMYFFF